MKIPGFVRSKYFLALIILVVAAIVYFAVSLAPHPPDTTTAAVTSPGEAKPGITLAAGDLAIEPTASDSAGVDVDSGFRLTSKKAAAPELIKNSLSVVPDSSFSIKGISDKEFLLSFDKPMEPDRVYRFALNEKDNNADYSWAFQTKKTFRVIRSLPRDEGTGVPLNSGIEITFSHEGVTGLENYFDILPKVNGRFEYHRKVAVFVPDGFDYGTVYTVKVKKGLELPGSREKLAEDYVFQFQTQLKEAENNTHYFNFTDDMYNFTSNAVPIFAVNCDDYFKNNDISVAIYSYKSLQDFKTDLEQYGRYPRWAQREPGVKLDKSRLDKYLSFRTRIIYADSPWFQQLLQFPDKLPAGYYAVCVTIDGKEYSAGLQVNDLSVYAMLGDSSKSLVWVNDSNTGDMVQGARVETDGADPVVTDASGVATFECTGKSETGTRFITITADNRPAFLVRISDGYISYFDPQTIRGGSVAERYWSYLYLDRGMYLTDDKIRFWGLLKPRDPKDAAGKLTVSLFKYSYTSYSSEETVLVSKDVELSPYGTFTGELPFENLNPGSYFVTVKSGDTTFEQSYVEIRDYTKPAYRIDVTQDKEACFLGDSVNFGVQAAFFEGTPVSGLNIDYRAYTGGDSIGSVPESSLKCGDDGKASFKYIPASSGKKTPPDWSPSYVNFVFENAQAEEEYVQTGATVEVFPGDVMIDPVGELKDNKLKIDIKTNRIDLKKLEKAGGSSETPGGPDGYYEEYPYRGDPLDMGLKVTVFEKHWEGKVIGKYYDFINKVTRDKYQYNEVTKQIGEFDLATVNGTVSCELPCPDTSLYSSYYIEVSGADSKNRPVLTTRYIYSANIYQAYLERMEVTKDYSLMEADRKSRFKAGETAAVKLVENRADFLMPPKGRVLFMVLKGGLADYSVRNDNRMDVSFTEDKIPDAYVKAVYFDGVNPYNAGNLILYYDYSERELNIAMKPDKAEYKPGDTVNISVEVTDKTGMPCEADVNLSVVDEAFFALWDQYVNTAASVYSYVFDSGVLSEFVSYRNIQAGYPAAECGEGGDRGPARYDFKDNAFFGSAATGPDGRGSISFRLPDNLTAWRVTGQAVTRDLKAGNAKINIDSRLPFFTTLLFNNTYLEGDAPGISLRCFGTKVGADSRIDYEVTVSGADGYKKTFRKEQTANEFCNISMDSLNKGDYTITASASCGEFKDAVKKDFKVVTNVLETSRIAYVDIQDGADLASGLNISAGNSLAEVTFYNRDLSEYSRVLNSLYYSWGGRVDQVLARKLAGEYLKKYFKSDSADTEDISLKDYQTDDGGIALLTYDSPDPELTAKLCPVGKQYFDDVGLESYFTSIIENKESPNEDIAASYWGLASLGRPVLLDVRAYLKEEGLSLKEKLYLGNALAELGDYSGATEAYAGLMKLYGKVLGGYRYLDSGGGSDQNVEMTALCSLMAMKLDTPEKDQLFGYIIEKSTDELLVSLEKITYLRDMLPHAVMKGAFTIEWGSGAEKVTLEGMDRRSFVVTSERLKGARLSGVSGNVEAAVRYIGPLSMLDTREDNPVGINRNYRINGKVTDTFRHSDIVEVNLQLTFSSAAPEGYYQITDVLPSGLRYIPPREWKWEDWHLISVDGQKVNFGYYRNPTKSTASIRYLARVVSPGAYTADNAVIKYVKSQFYAFSGRNKVTVNGD